MNAPTTLAAYAVALGLVFGAAATAGAAVGPVGTPAQDRSQHQMSGETAPHRGGDATDDGH